MAKRHTCGALSLKPNHFSRSTCDKSAKIIWHCQTFVSRADTNGIEMEKQNSQSSSNLGWGGVGWATLKQENKQMKRIGKKKHQCNVKQSRASFFGGVCAWTNLFIHEKEKEMGTFTSLLWFPAPGLFLGITQWWTC